MRIQTQGDAPDHAPEDELDFASLAQALRRQARLIAVTVLLSVTLAGTYLILTPPTYTAQALILFDPAQKDLLEDDLERTNAQSDNARIDSEVEILRAPTIALTVIERADLMRDPEFAPQAEPGLLSRLGLVPAAPDPRRSALRSTVLRLSEATQIQRRGLTYLIAVEVSSQRPDQAADLTNLMAETYIEAQVDAKIAASLGARDVLQARIEAGRAAVMDADAALDQFLRPHRAESDLPPERLAQVFGLEQEAAIARTQYQTLLSRLRDLEAQARSQVADSRVVSKALVPNRPSAPDARLVLVIALVAGLSLGLGLAVLRDYVAGGITRPAQLRALLQAPVASCVPFVSPGLDSTSVADKILTEPLSSYAEAIRRLRVSLDQGARAHPRDPGEGQVVMITSAGSGEGKTALALALARLYAVSGKKTLLIDSDLRQPGVHLQAGLSPRYGLLDYLSDPSQTEVAGAFFSRDLQSPLSLVLGATPSACPTDQLIGSPIFERVLQDVRRSYDRIIIDTSPLVPVVDARMIVHHADAVVMVARQAATARADLRAAVQMLAEAVRPGARVYGVLSHQHEGTAQTRYTRAPRPAAPALNPL
jgi:capsular exopolysaccharide synthesis family protein